jgi:hypothetical protein
MEIDMNRINESKEIKTQELQKFEEVDENGNESRIELRSKFNKSDGNEQALEIYSNYKKVNISDIPNLHKKM